jgi:hypothetical protein
MVSLSEISKLSSVVSHKNVIKVVWYILVQLRSLSNTMSVVSGVSVQVSAFWPLASILRLLASRRGPDTRNLKPIYP